MSDRYIGVFERPCDCASSAGDERIEVRGEVQIHWCNCCGSPTLIQVQDWSDSDSEIVPEETVRTITKVLGSLEMLRGKNNES